MKTVMKFFSGLLVIAMICIICAAVFETDGDFTLFAAKCALVVILNIMPIVSIALCCYCLDRGDSNPFIRVIPMYMLVGIGITSILVFFNSTETLFYMMGDFSSLLTETLNIEVDGFSDILYKIYQFMSSTYLCITLICLLFLAQTTNSISGLIKKIAYVAIIINIALSMYIKIRTLMEDLPNVYDTDSYYSEHQTSIRVSSKSDLENFADKIYTATVIIESFSVVLLFITNYAFNTGSQFDATEIDYETLKNEAERYSTAKMAKIYSKDILQATEDSYEDPDAQNAAMNINPQMNNNVGQVKSQATDTAIEKNSAYELGMPFSQGPVINESVMPKQTPQQQEATPSENTNDTSEQQ